MLLKKVDEIERISNDKIVGSSLKDLKVTMNKTAIETTHKDFIFTNQKNDQKKVEEAVSGVRHKKYLTGINDQKKIEEGKKVQFRLVQNTGKFFYEVKTNHAEK